MRLTMNKVKVNLTCDSDTELREAKMDKGKMKVKANWNLTCKRVT